MTAVVFIGAVLIAIFLSLCICGAGLHVLHYLERWANDDD